MQRYTKPHTTPKRVSVCSEEWQTDMGHSVYPIDLQVCVAEPVQRHLMRESWRDDRLRALDAKPTQHTKELWTAT